MEEIQYKIEEILAEECKDVNNTEVKIMNSAIKNFAEKGYHNTKTKDIAVDAEIAEGTIFRYFKTKEDMLLKLYPLAAKIVIPRVIKDLVKKIDQEQALTESQFAKIIILDRLELFRRNYKLFKALIPEVMHRPYLAEQASEYIAPEILKTLRMLITTYIKGERKLENKALEMFIFTTLLSHGMIGLVKQDYLFRDSLDSEIAAYIDTVLGGKDNDASKI